MRRTCRNGRRRASPQCARMVDQLPESCHRAWGVCTEQSTECTISSLQIFMRLVLDPDQVRVERIGSGERSTVHLEANYEVMIEC